VAFKKLFDFIGWPVTAGILIALLALTLFPQLGQVSSWQEQKQPSGRTVLSYASAVQSAAPGVVNIYTTKKIQIQNHPAYKHPVYRKMLERQAANKQTNNSLGSGVIINKEGYLLTNNHVIAGSDSIFVQLYDGRFTAADLIGSDPESDLAVLKISIKDITPIQQRESNDVQVGDVVLAIGNPFGVGQSVTQGIISATRRGLLDVNAFENFIQTDAAINPGNSGGALVDANGKLVGINTALLNKTGTSVGISFAIPADYAISALQDIIEYGIVVRGWLGFNAEPLTPELAGRLGLKQSLGLIITNTIKNGPAHTAGIRPGDVIIAIDNNFITNGLTSLQTVTKIRPGTKLLVEFIRQGQTMSSEITVGLRPQPSPL